MSSKRQQIDEYFLNPVPSAGKMLDSEGLDQDDGDRMQAYFNKSGVEDFVPAESNRRTILPEIEMPDEAYRSKKVHRKDLEEKASSSEEDEEGNSEEGEAEISEEALEESQESELSEEMDLLQQEDAEVKKKRALLKQLEDGDEESDDDINAALDQINQDKTEEGKQAEVRRADDFEKAEAVST